MEDEAILDLYFARDEAALAETNRKYGSYCFTVANAVLDCREDAEETVSDTLLRTWDAIPPQRPKYLRLFLAKIARNLAFTRWRKKNARRRGGGETELALEELAGCIEKMQSLTAEAYEEMSRSALDRAQTMFSAEAYVAQIARWSEKKTAEKEA